MSNGFKTFILFAGLILGSSVCHVASGADGSYGAMPSNIHEFLDRLVKYYPDTVSDYDDDFLILKSGQKFRISDNRTDKTFQELLEKPDIDDMFYARYPAGTAPKQPEKIWILGGCALSRCLSQCMAIAEKAKCPEIYAPSSGCQSTTEEALSSPESTALTMLLKPFRINWMSCRIRS